MQWLRPKFVFPWADSSKGQQFLILSQAILEKYMGLGSAARGAVGLAKVVADKT